MRNESQNEFRGSPTSQQILYNSLADQLHQSTQKISIVNKEVRPERTSDNPYLSEARPPIAAVTDLLEYELRVLVGPRATIRTSPANSQSGLVRHPHARLLGPNPPSDITAFVSTVIDRMRRKWHQYRVFRGI